MFTILYQLFIGPGSTGYSIYVMVESEQMLKPADTGRVQSRSTTDTTLIAPNQSKYM